MYLTRLRLDPRSAAARRDLADPYELHRTLVRAFVREAADLPPRILWRQEPVVGWGEAVVLVQAAEPGDWTTLEQLPHYLKATPETKPLQWVPPLAHGGRYRFRLVANATVAREGKRYGLVTEDLQQAWLARQGQRCGFALEASFVAASERVKARKGEMTISLHCTRFEGVLLATDVAALSRALASGIGPGKALGCGMLSLAPLPGRPA